MDVLVAVFGEAFPRLASRQTQKAGGSEAPSSKACIYSVKNQADRLEPSAFRP
jgi:hypothetical protein